MIRVLVLALVIGSVSARAQGSAPSPVLGQAATTSAEAHDQWQRLVSILQYLESDYPAAVDSKSPSELEEQRAFIAEAMTLIDELGQPAAQFRRPVEQIQKRVDGGEDAPGVSRDCAALVEDAVLASGLSRSPRHPPDLKHATELYATNCAICHGAKGNADTELAKTQNPPPANFQSAARMDPLTPFKAFNALTFGVPNTPMPSFSTLSEEERWSLAFYVFTLRQPECDHKPPYTSLEQLATESDAQLVQADGQKELACLRRRIPDTDEERSLLVARSGVEDAIKKAGSGDFEGARREVLDAYLQGIEPVEPLLRSRNPKLVSDLEAAFTSMRIAAEQRSPSTADSGHAVLMQIDRARKSRPNAQDFVSVFWLSLLILLREGFEATVVIAALIAVLKKMKQEDLRRIVHAGWISAVFVGAAAFLFARHLITGQNREMIEGVFALLAVGMLLYAALWLNAKANVRKFMGELREKMQGALGRGSAVGLFTIAFTAMLRESLETAVFLQGLSIDSPSGVMWGVLGGLVVLTGLVLFISRVGYRLPMKALFNASTVLLVATSVILLGQGLHSMQEMGVLPLKPVPMFEFEALGIFPDALTLIPQLLLALAPSLWWLLHKEPSAVDRLTHPRSQE